MTPSSFENGQLAGKTEATLQGLAHSMDIIRADLNRLIAPDAGLCAERGRMIEQIAERQKTLTWMVRGMWGLVCTAGLALAAWWANNVGVKP